MLNMGGINTFLDKLPGMGDISQKVKDKADDSVFQKKIAIINSMTLKERKDYKLLKAPRRMRIAKGSGVDIQDVHRLVKEFEQMQRMMKELKKGGIGKVMRSFQSMKKFMPK